MDTSSLSPAHLLRLIGMHPRYKGYAYILFILTLLREKPEYLYNLRAKVYPLLMERFDCSMAGIERNIRFVVQRTCERGNLEALSMLFGCSNWPPTNSEFIAVLSQCHQYGMVELPVQNRTVV